MLNTKPKDTLSELVRLLQQANEREDALKRDVEHWHRAYNALLQEHMAFKYEDLCSACKRHRNETEAGETILLCKECSTVEETKQPGAETRKGSSRGSLLARLLRNVTPTTFRG